MPRSSASSSPDCQCGHPWDLHGDRALPPACEGGYDGKTIPPIGLRNLYHKRCLCQGYSA